MDLTYAGIDLGGTTILAALGTATGRLLDVRSVPTRSQEGPEAVLQRIAGLVRELGGSPAAAGLGIPGLVDVASGCTRFLPNFPTQWRDVPVKATLGAALGCPVYILNDARLATLGELRFGAGRSANSMLLFTLGTGIGGGVVVDRRLRLEGGELGHQTVAPDGPRCGCGNIGCLEAVASAPALMGEGVRLLRSGQAPHLEELIGGDIDRLTPREMGLSRDAAIGAAITRAGRYLAIAAANLVTALDPDLIVYGGGMSGLERLLEVVRAEVQERVRMFPVTRLRVERSALGDQAGIFGGLALAVQGGLETSDGWLVDKADPR